MAFAAVAASTPQYLKTRGWWRGGFAGGGGGGGMPEGRGVCWPSNWCVWDRGGVKGWGGGGAAGRGGEG